MKDEELIFEMEDVIRKMEKTGYVFSQHKITEFCKTINIFLVCSKHTSLPDENEPEEQKEFRREILFEELMSGAACSAGYRLLGVERQRVDRLKPTESGCECERIGDDGTEYTGKVFVSFEPIVKSEIK